MTNMFRSVLLHSVGATALLVSGIAMADAQTVTVNGGGSTLAQPAYQQQISDDTSSNVYNYYPSGSSAAQNAFLSNASIDFGGAAPTNAPVHFGASDATLTTTQISTFLAANASHPLIQLPTFGTPITVPFKLAGRTTNGAVNLSDAQLCGVFSGQITDWHTIDSTIAANTTIEVAFRNDGSGTSFLMTQHLGAVCTPSNSAFYNTGMLHAGQTSFGGTTTFASLFGTNTLPLNFIHTGTPPTATFGQTGSGGVEAVIVATPNSIGYLSPDFTKIAPINNSSLTLPPVASVNMILPTGTPLTNAFAGATFPNGLATGLDMTNQNNWVPAIPLTAAGTYPIVGYTTWEIASCYASASTGAAVVQFLNNLYNTAAAGSLGSTFVLDYTNRGFVPVSGVSKTAKVQAVAAGTAYSNLGQAIYNQFLGGTPHGTGTPKLPVGPNTAAACTGGRAAG